MPLRTITENTKIQLTIVLTFVGGIFFISTMYAQGLANRDDIVIMKGDYKELATEVNKSNLVIIEKLTRMEEQLKQLEQRGK